MNNKISTASNDVGNLINEARDRFNDAAGTPIAEKAAELRKQGAAALDQVGATYDELSTKATETASEVAGSVDAFVQANPWRATVLAAAIGILGGVLIARRD